MVLSVNLKTDLEDTAIIVISGVSCETELGKQTLLQFYVKACSTNAARKRLAGYKSHIVSMYLGPECRQ